MSAENLLSTFSTLLVATVHFRIGKKIFISGKSLLMNTIIKFCDVNEIKQIVTATSGVAAISLTHGTTTHSAFS